MKNSSHQKPFAGPFLLCVLDGVGLAPPGPGNAVTLAKTPVLDGLLAAPHGELVTHGAAVGLPEGQMGNSEVGHMAIGTGRVVLQSLERIRADLASGAFASRPQWQNFTENARTSRAIHLFGLISDGGVHAHTDHAVGVCRLLSGLGVPVFVHAITDGRDTAPTVAANQIQQFMEQTSGYKNVYITDVAGRFYTMDRDSRWERTAKAWAMYTKREGVTAADPLEAATQALARGETDEFISPTAVALPETLDPRLRAGDTVFLFNFRADRMRQLTRCLIDDTPPFPERGPRLPLQVATMTEFDASFEGRLGVIYPPHTPPNTLGEVVQTHGLRQLRIAESEKYAHVTFFLNGGREEPFEGEDRIVVPSPKVKTYDLRPEMSLPEVTEKVVADIETNGHEFIALNIANGDQVGHSGVLSAAVAAMEAVDTALGKILSSLEKAGGEALIIADHGNCEQMLDTHGKTATAHTLNPVPCLYVGRPGATVASGGLVDVAPTVLTLMGLPIPPEMEGKCLISF